MRSWMIAFSLISAASAGSAADDWVPVGPANPPNVSAPLANLGAITLNGEGHRVTTMRAKIANGYQMDILTEYDCAGRRTRALAAAITDKNGQLVSSKGQDDWIAEAKSGLDMSPVCQASVPAK